VTPENNMLNEIRAAVEQLPDEERYRVEAIAWTLRNIFNEKNGRLAFALVGAEEAAKL
jgi:hypothetical protein